MSGRGLLVGTAIGAVIGALTPAFAVLLTRGWGVVLGGLAFGIFGVLPGAAVGFLCAIFPAAILASHRNYFLRHDLAARLCTISAGALLLVVAGTYTAVHWNGNVVCEAIATVPLTGGLVLGAWSTDYVLRGSAVRAHRCCCVRARLTKV